MNESIRKKTKQGIAWSGIEKIATQAVSFILNIILARLLTPEDYGTVGLLTVFINIATVFIESGFSRALIQKQDRTETDFCTIFYANIFISIIFYILFFAISPLISNFYNRPELTKFARVLFIVIIINSFCFVQNVKLQINIDFKGIALINLTSSIVSGITGVFLAYKGFGVWALIIQNLTRNLTVLILLIIKIRWIPHSNFSIISFKLLFGFGWKILVTQILYTIINNISDLFIGKKYSPRELGLYTRAQQFPNLVCGTVSSVLNTSTFPLLASLQNNNDEMKVVFSKLIKYVNLFIIPCMFGMAVLSREIILVLLSEKWIEVVPYLQLASISFIFDPLILMNNSLMLAKGRSDLYMICNLIKLPLTILWLVITLPMGVRALLIGRIIFMFISFCINSYYTYKVLRFGCIMQLANSWKGIVATLVMSLVIFLYKSYLNINIVLLTITAVIIGIVIYSIVLLLLKEKEFVSILKKIGNKNE